MLQAWQADVMGRATRANRKMQVRPVPPRIPQSSTLSLNKAALSAYLEAKPLVERHGDGGAAQHDAAAARHPRQQRL